uniref:Uncharacterized protein n=1 Tax=Tanacetum cinerariifolium TaxID=118510 RepID=A0A6L2LKY1_TANCI|nr:hypothetical protein [Tanacetum cinerariifolium]
MSYLTDYKEIDGGYVAFGGNPKGGKITGKCTIKTSNLDFENMYFVRELKFNLFSVSQMCDKKNSVLFNDTECIVLSPNFKLTDESQVLLRVPRKNNMYSVDLKNIIPKGGLTCLFAKATYDESKLWHRRPDHLGKFDGKADEGFFVRYSLNSKVFRVFNSRTRIVKENLHIKFSESTPNVVGSGLDWLFDIDALIRTMNYEPIVVGTQSNDLADLKSSHNDGSKPSSDDGKKVDEDPRKENECNDQEKEDNVNNTNNVNTAGNVNIVSLTVSAAGTNEVNAVGGKISIKLPFDPKMPALEDDSIFDFSSDDEDDGVALNGFFRNKNDERGIVIRNKARLVAQGYTQEEGIDYDEVFAPVSRIEAIRLFLAFASFKDFMVYQMNVKSAFLYGKIEEEMYVCQPPGFEDPNFPDRVYKVEKELYGLNQAPRAWYETLSTYLLDNEFYRRTYILLGIKKVKTASTLMETQKPLLKDEHGEEVDVHMYRSMIGSLMYLTSSRPDIMFAVCAYARYQVNQKVSHLYAVKRIFRYLKGQPKLGLWYLKDSPFNLVAYTDSDYARASLDRKSTTRGCQFLGCRLISW